MQIKEQPEIESIDVLLGKMHDSIHVVNRVKSAVQNAQSHPMVCTACLTLPATGVLSEIPSKVLRFLMTFKRKNQRHHTPEKTQTTTTCPLKPHQNCKKANKKLQANINYGSMGQRLA